MPLRNARKWARYVKRTAFDWPQRWVKRQAKKGVRIGKLPPKRRKKATRTLQRVQWEIAFDIIVDTAIKEFRFNKRLKSNTKLERLRELSKDFLVSASKALRTRSASRRGRLIDKMSKCDDAIERIIPRTHTKYRQRLITLIDIVQKFVV